MASEQHHLTVQHDVTVYWTFRSKQSVYHHSVIVELPTKVRGTRLHRGAGWSAWSTPHSGRSCRAPRSGRSPWAPPDHPATRFAADYRRKESVRSTGGGSETRGFGPTRPRANPTAASEPPSGSPRVPCRPTAWHQRDYQGGCRVPSGFAAFCRAAERRLRPHAARDESRQHAPCLLTTEPMASFTRTVRSSW